MSSTADLSKIDKRVIIQIYLLYALIYPDNYLFMC